MTNAATRELPLPDRIRRARRKAGLSQDRLAAALGTTRQIIIGWEKGRHRPGLHYRQRLAGALGGTPDTYRDREAGDEEDD